jgi:translocation and assembly module TamB
MAKKNATPKKKRSVGMRILRGFAIFFTSLILLLIIVVLLVQTAPVQNFLRKKAVAFLEKKLKTRVEIGKIDIDFPNSVVLQNVYFEDQTKDTLLAGGEMKVDIDMMKLLDNEISIGEINLNSMTIKVKRLLPDTTFNFQFIVDAFATEQTKDPAPTDTAALKMNISKLVLDKIHIVYKDVLTGNDMDMYLNHLDTRIDKFDPTRLMFDFPRLNIDGLTGYFYQVEPLEKKLDSAVAKAVAAPGPAMQIMAKELLVKNVSFAYRSVPGKMDSYFKIGNLKAYPKRLDLANGAYEFSNLVINNSDIGIKMTAQASANQAIAAKPDTAAAAPFVLRSDKITITGTNFKMDDMSKPAAPYGMDYAHLGLENINLDAAAFTFRPDSIMADIRSANLREKSGFVLDELTTRFAYTNTGATLQDLYLKTPGTVLRRNLTISWPSLELLQKDVGQLGLDLDLASSVVKVKDILTFAPALRAQPAFSNPHATFLLNARIRGKMNALKLDNLQFRGLQQTNIDLAGTITGLPDPKKFSADLNIRKLSSGRSDIMAFVPKGTLPDNISIPETFSASGSVRGNASDMNTNLQLATSDGNVRLQGKITNGVDPKTARYDMAVSTARLNLGKIMKNPQLGPVTATLRARGTGFDLKTANAKVEGRITWAVFNNYAYTDVPLTASISNQQFNARTSISDPNIDMTLEASGRLGDAFPAINIVADVDSIKTLPLNLTPDAMIFRGKVRANFTNTDPDRLAGNFFLTNSILVANGERVSIDTLTLLAAQTDSGQVIQVQSDFVTVKISGQYRLTQIGDVFLQTINPYFSIAAKYLPKKIDPYNFNVTAYVIDHPGLRAFVPGLTELEPVAINMNMSSTAGMTGNVTAPLIVMQGNRISDLRLTAATVNNQIELNTSLAQLVGGGIQLNSTSIGARIANNTINLDLATKDRAGRNKYALSAALNQPRFGDYSFSLSPNNLLLNYDKWSVNPDNRIDIVNGGVIANNFVLSQGGEQLSINSTTQTANSPLSIDFKDFKIATLVQFVQSDSMMVNGNINGNVLVRNIQTQPSFTTDLTVADLSFNRDTLGNLRAQVSNVNPNIFNTNVTLSGRGNDVTAKGTYYLKPANASTFDIDVNIGALQLSTLEGATMGSLKNASGTLTGKIALRGTAANPDIDGRINFENTAFTLAMLNSRFQVDDESIAVDNSGITFNTFTIRDSLNNTAVLDGHAYTNNFMDYKFALTLRAKDFQVLKTTKKENKLYYGDLFITTNLNVAGTNLQPVVDGNLKVEPKTKLSVVLPQAEPGMVEREGVVRFVDYDNMGNDSLFLAAYDSLNTSPLLGMDIATNIEIDKEAELNLIIDEGNGDFLNVKGEASLTAGIDPSGKINMTGSYELMQGAYELSFNFLRRRFDIEKGSKIVWTGEPTSAQVDVTAIYEVEIAPLDLVANQLSGTEGPSVNIYRQKLPFQIVLNMDGELMKPLITFDVRLKEGNYGVSKDIISNVETKLAQIRQEPAELNKQAFAVILLNRFVTESPFDNSSGGLDAGAFARQSASKLLTEQLNRLAGDLINGVDINFDVASSEDFTTGERRQRTDFNVALSKRLMDDRLSITVGSNFELEGPRKANAPSNNLAGNLAIDYALTKDQRYLIRAYRKNEYEGVLEGYVVETGLRFIMSMDYDRFREIFKSRAKRRQEREERKQAGELLKQREAERVASDSTRKSI